MECHPNGSRLMNECLDGYLSSRERNSPTHATDIWRTLTQRCAHKHEESSLPGLFAKPSIEERANRERHVMQLCNQLVYSPAISSLTLRPSKNITLRHPVRLHSLLRSTTRDFLFQRLTSMKFRSRRKSLEMRNLQMASLFE